MHRQLPSDSPLFSVLVNLLEHPDLDVRETTLKCLHELCKDSSNLRQLSSDALGVRRQLAQRAAVIRSFPDPEDRAQCRDELELIESLRL